jgi:acyl-coenzyme A synthetase/AMP-(fatty) acid ligase
MMHRNAVVWIESLIKIADYTEKDIVVNVPKLFFHYARLTGLDSPFRAGSTVVLFSERTTAETVFNLIEKYKPTVLLNVPTMMRAMIQVPPSARKDLSSLRFTFSSGEYLSGELYNDWVKTFNVPVADILGSAESGAPYLGNKPGFKVPGSLGKALDFVNLKIVDKEGKEVPRGTVGTLVIHNEAAGLLYVRQHEKSKETFIGDDWVSTSDLFKQDEDGNYWFIGRDNEQVKVSGVWVSLQEIENCLAKNPAVKDACVLGIEDRDGLTKVKAYVALNDKSQASEKKGEELKQYCKTELAAWKSPKTVVFLDEIPKTEAGKKDKRKLRTM